MEVSPDGVPTGCVHCGDPDVWECPVQTELGRLAHAGAKLAAELRQCMAGLASEQARHHKTGAALRSAVAALAKWEMGENQSKQQQHHQQQPQQHADKKVEALHLKRPCTVVLQSARQSLRFFSLLEPPVSCCRRRFRYAD